MRDLHLHTHGVARPHVARLELFAVAADRELHRSGSRALILNAQDHGLLLADDAEARRSDELDASITLARASGDQRVDWRVEAKLRGFGRHVVHAPIGDEEGARDTIRRHVRQRRAKRGEQPRSVGLAVRMTGFDHAYLKPRDAAEPLRERIARGLSLLLAIAEILARALVDHHH